MIWAPRIAWPAGGLGRHVSWYRCDGPYCSASVHLPLFSPRFHPRSARVGCEPKFLRELPWRQQMSTNMTVVAGVSCDHLGHAKTSCREIPTHIKGRLRNPKKRPADPMKSIDFNCFSPPGLCFLYRCYLGRSERDGIISFNGWRGYGCARMFGKCSNVFEVLNRKRAAEKQVF